MGGGRLEEFVGLVYVVSGAVDVDLVGESERWG